MNNRDNYNFETLKQALKLKRHEVPPPGYFQKFSGKVISRIHAGDSGGRQSFNERLQYQAPWLANLFQLFETKPGLIGAFAIASCLVLVLGVVLAERSDSAPKDLMTTADSAAENSNTENPSLLAPMLAAASDTSGGIVSSTNPVVSLQPAATLFGQQNPLFQPAAFAPAGN